MQTSTLDSVNTLDRFLWEMSMYAGYEVGHSLVPVRRVLDALEALPEEVRAQIEVPESFADAEAHRAWMAEQTALPLDETLREGFFALAELRIED